MDCPECNKHIEKRELAFPHELRCYYIYYCPSCNLDIVVKVHEDGLKEAINDLAEDISTKPQALHNSKGGDAKMSEPKKEEKMPESGLQRIMRILKTDHNWKLFAGLILGWILRSWINW